MDEAKDRLKRTITRFRRGSSAEDFGETAGAKVDAAKDKISETGSMVGDKAKELKDDVSNAGRRLKRAEGDTASGGAQVQFKLYYSYIYLK